MSIGKVSEEEGGKEEGKGRRECFLVHTRQGSSVGLISRKPFPVAFKGKTRRRWQTVTTTPVCVCVCV